MLVELLSNALTAGFGAFFGAIGAYWLACRQENARHKREYLCLLLIVYEQLESLYTLFADIPAEGIKEVDGVKVVVFDIPLPELGLSTGQMQRIMELAPDKQMPSTLIKVQHFLKSHSLRVAKSGSTTIALDYIDQQARQLQFMLLSVRVQYEQAANVAFPLDNLMQASSQK